MYLLCPCHLDSQKPAQAKGAKMIPGSPENDTEKIGFIRFLHNRRWLFWKFLSLCGFVWFLQIFHTHETRSQGDKEMGREGDMETGRQGDRETRTLYRGTTAATIHLEAYFGSVMTNCIRDGHFSLSLSRCSSVRLLQLSEAMNSQH